MGDVMTLGIHLAVESAHFDETDALLLILT